MEKWQIDMINKITLSHPDYDNEIAVSLAKEWNETDEKWLMVTDHFCLYNSQERAVKMIERKFEKILNETKTEEKELEHNWLRLCGE
tara:strand:+ start:459 stop:719 length:261 start_codon:yes stop_codon:yes gene_type:complete